MNLSRCENGHFYDTERFDTCPHCNQTTISTVIQDPENGSKYTEPVVNAAEVSQTPPVSTGLQGIITEANSTEDGAQKTIGYFGDVTTQPVVGWLVAITGSHQGQDFKLKTGRNFIGRGMDMDVVLADDASISRSKHAIILYEPKGNIFLVQPGDAKELFYLNDNVVLAATEIKAYDILSLGDTQLLFVPCCSEKFNWDSIKKADEADK